LYRAHQGQQFLFARRFQFALQLVGGVEMVLNGALAAAGDEDHVADAGGVGLFHGVLDQWLVHHRQHLLGRCLGGRQKARAQPGDGENGLANGGLLHGVCS
jgi:hypothetical protein